MMLHDKYGKLLIILCGLFVMFLGACVDMPSNEGKTTSERAPPVTVPPVKERTKPTSLKTGATSPPVLKTSQRVVHEPEADQGAATIINILLDLSGSIKGPQFKQANTAADRVLNLCHERAQLHPGERADFLSVNWFGSHGRYEGTKFINCSSFEEMLTLSLYLDSKPYKPLGNTAIYSAIWQAANESLQQEKIGTGKYLKVIIVVTDGKDTNSPQEIKGLVRALFPNRLFFLAVIGVGPKANVNEFKDIADHIDNISNFYTLAMSIMATVELAGIVVR